MTAIAQEHPVHEHFCDVKDFRLNDVIDSDSDSFALNIRHCYSRKPQSQQGGPRKVTQKMPMILRARKPIDLDDKKAKNVVNTNPNQKQISKIPKLKTKNKHY